MTDPLTGLLEAACSDEPYLVAYGRAVHEAARIAKAAGYPERRALELDVLEAARRLAYRLALMPIGDQLVYEDRLIETVARLNADTLKEDPTHE